ncbi:hypothetical protein [Bacillus cereus group sp. BY5-1LC]|uniref:hypothetical protein n=1 Tax=Bacillus cereus group sp. BY5-1LC TaxID=3018078 RepID=UPI0022E5EB20|nr:hypothetical protein [Bacillus cereus group sp. BY5-1LC]MDA1792126.1 hypothetical protein [Bacillus cereus group sp. BY5-1LC]
MGDVIRFPKPLVELTEEEYAKFIEYKEKMNTAESKAEMQFYYNKAKYIIERKNK